ncbi:nitroreductase family protein [Bacteroidales bacterium]|nr:nitroreductase family protein [Bacteroidales bacterium]
MELLKNHRSIRKFKTTSIPEKTIEDIMQCTARTSTTGNMQLYSVIMTTEPPLKEKLWESHFKQNMVKEAPAVFTFCADFNRFNLWCNQRNAKPGYDNYLSFFTAAIDALIAAQNFCIAAESHGLGICYLGTTTYMAQKIIDTLNIPHGVVPVTTIIAGYPDETPEQEDRLPVSGILHKETYQNYSAQTIDEIYKNKESLEKTKTLLEENQKETLAQIFTDNRYKKDDNMLFSKLFLDVIVKQGFMNNDMPTNNQ